MNLHPRTLVLTALTMMSFAANAVLCRAALQVAGTDPGRFTALRIVAGAVSLSLIVTLVERRRLPGWRESWFAAVALVIYAAGFSYAYQILPAGVGSLILIGAVQATMISYGLWRGEKLHVLQTLGLLLALGGLVSLLLPGLSAPPLAGAVLMGIAGIGWGAYSLRGRGSKDPTCATAGNFVWGAPLAIAVGLIGPWITSPGVPMHDGALATWAAIISGAITSGLGYIVWYRVLPQLAATEAATCQLSVPVLTATGGVLFLGETMTWRLLLCSIAILGGIGLVIAGQRRRG